MRVISCSFHNADQITYSNFLNICANLYINLRRVRDCLWVSVAAGRPVWVCGVDSLEVCVNAPLHLLILGKCHAVHINASSL